MKNLVPAVFVIFAAVSAPAQVQGNFRASITGGGGDGKCTIEVDVDDVAMVEISGAQGRLITMSGQPAEWRRMQCNQPMPADPYDFRFTGIDGRGRVSMVRDPRQNRGVAVIRIEDNRGGREGYTFDLEWRGGGGNRGTPGGYDRRDNDRRDNDDRRIGNAPGDGRGFGRGRGRNTLVISCSSNGRRSYCEADTRGGVLMLRQHGNADCRQGYSWGYDHRGIWVDRGCRADFEVTR